MAGREDSPIMRLIIEKGPSEGQIHDFMPRSGSEIKIGRIVRGNKVTIKDQGISSKHASFRFDSQSGGTGGFWYVSDLGSSNGTFLNQRGLEPFIPVAISDGDVIKIGELTSIVVKLEDVRVEGEENNVRRNQRGQYRNLEVTDSTTGLRLGKENEKEGNVRGRNRRGKAALEKNEVTEVNGIDKVGLATLKMVTRSAAEKKKEVETENLVPKAPPRRNRRRKEENEAEEKANSSLKKDHHNSENLTENKHQNCDEVGMALPTDEKVVQNLGENEEPESRRRRCTRGRKNLGLKTLTENEETEEVGKEVLEEKREECGRKTDGLVRENDGIEVDLEKITLGEWFDFLEVHLPKQIIDATEGMILDMKQKAAKFHDFLLQQKNSNSKN